MARIKSIRITENDRKEFARMVKNSKSKIARTKKKYGVDLDDKVELPSTVESFTTRKEFNEWKEKTASFTNRNNLNFQFVKNPYDVVASKKEINEIARTTKKAQRIADQLSEQAKNKPFISGGKEQGTVGQQMLQMGKPNTAGIVRPPDFDFNRIRNKDQLKNKKKSMEERSQPDFFDKRMIRMKNNYINQLHDAFNSDANDLVVKIIKLNPDDFYELYLIHDEFNFDYVYPLEESGDLSEESKNAINKMSSIIDLHNEGKSNMDLKGYPPR